MDTGCDLLAAGLSGTTSDGVTPKYLDFIDCTGDGDVPMGDEVIEFKYNEDGENTVQGLSGRTLILGGWARDVTELKLGAVRLYELLPRGVMRRVKKERKEAFMAKHQALISATQMKLDQLNVKKRIGNETDSTDNERDKKELKLMLEQLDSIIEFYDEESGPLMDIIMFQDGDIWKAIIDLEADGDLSNSTPLAPFGHARDIGELGFGSHVTFCIQVYDEGKTLSIVTDSGSHGTHVAGIAAAYFEKKSGEEEGLPSHDLNGVAPGAQILALKIGDGRLGSAETGTGLIRGLIAAKKYGCDLVNLSFGEPSWQPDVGRVSKVFEKAFKDWGMCVFTSAGNDGPALSSLGSPGSLTNIITVGAWASPAMMTEQYSTLPPEDGDLQATSYYFSSRGPTPDGLLPDICGPGGAVAPVPRAALQGKAQYHGTSMSSPNVCGVAACILSTIRKHGVQTCSPDELKRALKNTAVSGGIDDPFSQGAGLVSALNCAEYIINNHGKNGQDMAIDVCVPSRNKARGIYIRDEIELDGPMTFNVQVKPKFSHANQRTIEEMNQLLSLQIHLMLRSSAPWVTCPDSMTLMSAEERNGQTFGVRMNTQELMPGVHYASLDALDAADEKRGPLFTLPITVIIPHSRFVSVEKPRFELNESSEIESIELKTNGLDYTTSFELLQGIPNRRFITVPTGTEWVTIKLRGTNAIADGNSPRIYLHAIPFVRGDMPNTECQLKRIFQVNDGTEKEFHIRAKGGSTLELCLQTLWLANPSPALVTADIEFHSLNARSPSLLSSQPVTITAAAEFARLGVGAPLRTEQLNPSCSLKSVLRTLRPSNVEITLGSLERDDEPQSDAALASNAAEMPSQIYESRLSYQFKISSDKTIDVRPSFPSIFNQLYDSPLDAQIWSLHDSNSKIITYGSSMHHANSVPLKKGDYTVNLLIRHPCYSFLDKMKDIPCEISLNLKDSLSCNIYKELDKASTPAVKDDSSPLGKLLLSKGAYQDIYVSRPTSEVPKWCEPGDVMTGILALDKEKETITSMKVLYVVPPKTNIKNGDSSDEEESKSKKEESLEDVVFKARLGHLAGMRSKNATVYGELASELKKEKPSSMPLLSELLLFASEGPIPDNITHEEKYRADEIDKVYNASQKVNGGPIDFPLLAQYFGLNSPDKDDQDADDKVKELHTEMCEQRDFLKKILLSKASIQGSIATNSSSTDFSAFDESIKELKQWVKLDNLKNDDDKIKFTITLARHARIFQKRKALALSMLLKAKKDLNCTKSLKLVDEELLALLDSAEDNHLKENIQEALYNCYPVLKRSV